MERALANELRAANDTSHPMRYKLRKTSPRLTTTKWIVESSDGGVARLISINDQPLNAADEEKEQARLDGLLSDPDRQRHRKLSEDQDQARVLKIMRALPRAFLYEPAAAQTGAAAPASPAATAASPAAGSSSPAATSSPVVSSSQVVKFKFKPNPAFDPPDLETHALTVMTGEIWIDPAKERVLRLEGHLQEDVDFGWGLLGRLNKGGSILIEQADVGDGRWRITHLQMSLSGRVLFKARVFDTVEDASGFTLLPAGTTYRKAIEMLRAVAAAPMPATQ